MERIKLTINVEIMNEDECAQTCPFLDEDICLLFSHKLEETELKDSEEWAGDGRDYQRNHRCKSFDTED